MRGRDLLSLSFRVIGLLFVALCAGSAANSLFLLSRSVVATGEVVAFERTTNEIGIMPAGDETGVLLYPVIEFSAAGETHSITGRSGSPNPRLAVGDPVSLRVPAGNPAGARIDSLMGLWGGAIILGGLALGFLVIGFLAPKGFGGDREQD